MDPDPEFVLAELTRFLRHLCESEEIELTTDTLLDDIPGMDSLRILQAVAHLEAWFHVEIDVVDLDDLSRVSDILSAIAAAHPEQRAGVGERHSSG